MNDKVKSPQVGEVWIDDRGEEMTVMDLPDSRLNKMIAGKYFCETTNNRSGRFRSAEQLVVKKTNN